MKIKLQILIVFYLFFSITINAQQKRIISLNLKTKSLPFGLEEKVVAEKPSIGLALSGGGARGLSQIGVLKAFKEAGIEIDDIAGTSMGSIVGGLYSAGFDIEQLDSIARSTDWDMLLSPGKKSRRELFVDQKITDDRALFTLRLNGFTPVIPTSFNNGQKLTNFLTRLTYLAPIQSNNNFDDLLYKYRAVCTDLISGKPVVLKSGLLGKAMRASSSVTFFLSPVKWDSLYLVDGGLVSNIPVSTARELGADVVVAVNTTSPLRPKEQMQYPWYVADQVVSIPIKLLNQKEIENADIVISPELQNVSAAEFVNIDSIINKGYEAAKKKVNLIKEKIDSALTKNLNKKEFFIKNIIYDKNQPDEFLSLLKKYKSKDSVSSVEIYKDIINLYDTGKFRKVDLVITSRGKENNLRFEYEARPSIRSVNIVGIDSIESSKIRSVINNLIDKPYSEKLVAGLVIEILRDLRRKGFILSEFINHSFDVQTGKLILRFQMGRISEIEIDGSYTRKSLILREIPIKEGDFLTLKKLSEGLKNLSATSFFENIELYVQKNSGKNELVVYVEEKVSSLLRFGFLVNEAYNAQISLDIRDENLFGSGTEVGAFIFGGAKNRAYIFELKNHRILNTYLTYNISAYYKFNDINTYSEKPTGSDKTFSREKSGAYRQVFYGASVSLGTQIEKFGNLIFTGKYQFDEVKNTEGDEVEPYKTKLVSIRISTTVDNLDRYPYPQKGLYFSGFYETAQSILGGEQSFTSIGMDFRYFLTLGKHNAFVPRLMMGFGDNTMPLSEQFILGGMNSFFGMRENEFRGRQIFLTSLMYRIKLPFQIFFDTYLKFRYDLGSTWAVQEQIRFKDLRHGIGGIISFDTPIGPAEFAIGRSFLLKRELPENPIIWGDIIFYFSIGYAVNL